MNNKKKHKKNLPIKKLLFLLGKSYLAINNPQKALLSLEEALSMTINNGNANKEREERSPSEWEINHLIGKCYEKLYSTKAKAIERYFESVFMEGCKIPVLYKSVEAIIPIIDNTYSELFDLWEEKIIASKTLMDEDKAGMYNLSGKFFFQIGNLNKATAKFQRGLFFSNKDKTVPKYIALIETLEKINSIENFINLGDIDIAFEELKKIKISSSNILSLKLKLLKLKSFYVIHDYEKSMKGLSLIIESCKNRILKNSELSWNKNFLINTLIDSYAIKARILIIKHRYLDALNTIEDALNHRPFQNDILFLKALILIEGQINISEGFGLITIIKNQYDLEKAINDNDDLFKQNLNSKLFLGFLYLLEGSKKEILVNTVKELETNRLEKARDEILGPDWYPEIGLYVLKGYLADHEKDYALACTSFYKAARRYQWRNNNTQARHYFEKIEAYFEAEKTSYKSVLEKDSDFQAYYWSYASQMLNESFQDFPPYRIKDKLEAAKNVWSKNPTITKDYPWAYTIIARIHQNLYHEGSFSINNLYQSVHYLLRARILNPSENGPKIVLAENLNYLGLYKNAFQMLEHTVDTGQEEFYLDTKTMISLNLGKFESETLGNIEKLIELYGKKGQNTSRFVSWQGYYIFGKKDDRHVEEALKKLAEAIQNDPNDIWSKNFRASVFWLSHRFDEAKEAAQEVLSYENREGFQNYKEHFAKAYYMADNLARAKMINEGYLETIDTDPAPDELRLFINIRQGNIGETQKDDFEKILGFYNQRNLIELKMELESIVALSKLGSFSEKQAFLSTANLKTINRWIKQLKDRAANPGVLSPDEEIQQYIVFNGIDDKKHNDKWNVLQAIKANYYNDTGRYLEAYNIYKKLPRGFDFPEASIVLKDLTEKIIEETIPKFSARNYPQIIITLNRLKPESTTASLQKAILLSLAHIHLDTVEKVPSILQHLSTQFPKIDTPLIANVLSNPHLKSSITPAALKQLMLLMELYLAINQDKLFAQYASNLLFTGSLSSLNFSVPNIGIRKTQNLSVIPLTIQCHENLDISLYQDKIKPSIQDKYGIALPHLEVNRNEALPMWTCILNLNEAHQVVYRIDKEVGNIMNHIKQNLLQQLDQFYTLQHSVHYLQLDIQEGSKSMADEILNDSARLLAFHQLLRALLKEQVSILHKTKIIQAFSEPGDSILDLLSGVRLALKPYLPGNRKGDLLIPVPIELEILLLKHLEKDDEKTFLAIDRAAYHTISKTLKELIKEGAMEIPKVLIVQDANLRYPLRQFNLAFFPKLLVISQDEVIPQNQRSYE